MYNRNKTDLVSLKGKPIWEKLFHAKVRYIDTLSDEYVKTIGTPTTGVSSYDSDITNGLTDVMITINDMVEYFKKGISVRVSRHADTKIIYDIIVDYLHAWNEQLVNNINIGNAPIEDLQLLDRFAAIVYPHAKNHFKSYDPIAKILGSFGFSQEATVGNIIGTTPKDKPDKFEDKHDSMSDMFAKAMANRSNSGKLWK